MLNPKRAVLKIFLSLVGNSISVPARSAVVSRSSGITNEEHPLTLGFRLIT